MSLHLGIDTGGTFTDFVLYDEAGRELTAWKVLSTPSDPTDAILRGLETIDDVGRIASIRLGTTVATNALLERRGARVAYVATRGFRDVPFIQRGNRRAHYDLTWVKPKPFCLRRDAYELTERVDHHGTVLIPLDETEVRALARKLRNEGEVQAVAVNLMFSFVRPDHELSVREIFAEEAPGLPISLSYEIDPRWKEDQRAMTTLADAYVKPIVGRQVRSFREKVAAAGVTGRMAMMKSNGSEMAAEAAEEQPVHLAVSGPTGGVIGAKHLAALKSIGNLATLDIGGTSTDVALVVKGVERFTDDYELEFGIPLRVPMIDIRTIGAGGGSIASLDKVGGLHVGPHSAGANPGPACYGFGGTQPTVTDANLVLGRIEPDAFLGGRMRLDVEAARRAVATVADPHGWSVERASLAIVRIMNNNMVGALRAVLVEQGHDPRDFALLTYGGAGPLHVCDLLHEANIPRGIIPNHPGQFSAYGFTMADARSDRRRSVLMRSRRFDIDRANAIMEDLSETVLADLRRQGHTSDVTLQRSLQMRYLGQNYELELPLSIDRFTEANLGSVWDDFHRVFEERYRFNLPSESIEVVDMGCTAVAAISKPDLPRLPKDMPEAAPATRRQVVFEEGTLDTPVYRRSDLAAGQSFAGPALVDEDVSVTVVRPGYQLAVDDHGNLEITRA
ncbi:hydantoinase/oxoprolinase family protein [Bauldia litoralis]|uniref:hydantoinase/oxoprolinase family protein n=1 Tax=Bauldia litoralis TaxID=665467 RepID=UPI0032669BA9